ncbi:eukaryotic translation initiation factor 5A-1-like [Patiria miniata]|uniref:Eukaryotic translation initiation factor 5A n=1 Tax=Patiria miniata TaxID=46514 RepID=A0A914BST9_PATMI|nr:eukaryotic translation initiation factor 5A-1-like [Patiria miniata]
MPRKTKASKKTQKAAAAPIDVIDIDDDCEGGDAGASKTFPIQCSALRKSGHVMMKGQPCKIVEMSTSQPGKHGHAKVHIVGIDIFTGKKYEDFCPSTHTMSVPHVKREDYQVIGVWDECVNLLDNKGISRGDIRLPEGELGTQIKTRFEAEEELMVTLMTSMDRDMICGLKKLPK